jgi:hypothetical protein
MAAAPGEGVETGGQEGREGLSLAGLHFGDAPVKQSDAAQELYRMMDHPRSAPRRFSYEGVRLGEQIPETFTLPHAPPQLARIIQQCRIVPPPQIIGVREDCGNRSSMPVLHDTVANDGQWGTRPETACAHHASSTDIRPQNAVALQDR